MENKPLLDSEISIKEKFKALSPKEKRQYIWEYYKMPIIITLLCILGICSFIHTIITRKDTYCNITYYNSYVDENELYALRDTLNSLLIENPNKSTILVNPIWSDSNASATLSPAEEIAIKVSAKEIDIAIVNSDYFNTQMAQDMFEDISTLDGFSELNIPEYNWVQATDSTGHQGVYGIKLDNLNYLNDINSIPTDSVLTIIVNSERKEHAMEILKIFAN